MLRAVVAIRPLLCFLPFKIDDADKISEFQKKNLFKHSSDETGFERVKNIYRLDEFDSISSELQYIVRSATYAAFFGGAYGGFIESRSAYIKFMEKNNATIYDNMYQAKKKIHDTVALSFGRGAWKWGWRMTLFTSTYTVVSTTIQVYRGKTSMLEYIVGGAMSGALYKANMGLRGAIVGGSLGGFLGTIVGGITLIILKASNITMEELRFWNTQWTEVRKEQWNKIHNQQAIEKNDALTESHDIRLEDNPKGEK
ncbi:RPII140-upstream gene protein [Arctopsyche grandis]|uniref:RPII140-upstream gene protein n=1 Tax=Arctopsyche grandis TaxID=121162 RepID=UPI00406D746B